MSYRKIVVDGQDWEWCTGKVHVQIRKQDKSIKYSTGKNEFSDNYWDDGVDIVITPGDVAAYIRRKSCPICRGNRRMHFNKKDSTTQPNMATCPNCKGKPKTSL